MENRNGSPHEPLSTESLENILKDTKAKDLGRYLKQNEDEMIEGKKPFADYIKQIIDKNRITQRDMFITAGVSDSYGYKILNMEKRTRNRDLILRFCLAAHMELVEVNRALKLYGMTPLYAKVKRDAALIIAFNTHMYDIADVDDLLAEHDLDPLYDYDKDD